jgi:hypothetical protein
MEDRQLTLQMKMRGALLRLEWSGKPVGSCPICGRRDLHADTCWLARLLREIR